MMSDEQQQTEQQQVVVEKALVASAIGEIAQRSGWGSLDVAASNVLITPQYVRQISDLHRVVLERVAVDVPTGQDGPNKWETRDLYTMQGKLAPTKHLLDRIALMAGVKWDVARCRFDHISPEMVVYTAVGGIRGPSGEMVWMPATKHWQLDVEVDEIEERAVDLKVWSESARKKVPATPEQQAKYIKQEIARAKKHSIPMTESKARLRVLRALLGVPGAADCAYWSRPLLVPRIDVILDASDPQVRAAIIGEATGARSLLGYPTQSSDSDDHEPTHLRDIELDGDEYVVPDDDVTVDDPEPSKPRTLTDEERAEAQRVMDAEFPLPAEGEQGSLMPDPFAVPEAVTKAGEFEVPFRGDFGGMTIADTWASGNHGREYVKRLAKLPSEQYPEVRTAAATWADHHADA